MANKVCPGQLAVGKTVSFHNCKGSYIVTAYSHGGHTVKNVATDEVKKRVDLTDGFDYSFTQFRGMDKLEVKEEYSSPAINSYIVLIYECPKKFHDNKEAEYHVTFYIPNGKPHTVCKWVMCIEGIGSIMFKNEMFLAEMFSPVPRTETNSPDYMNPMLDAMKLYGMLPTIRKCLLNFENDGITTEDAGLLVQEWPHHTKYVGYTTVKSTTEFGMQLRRAYTKEGERAVFTYTGADGKKVEKKSAVHDIKFIPDGCDDYIAQLAAAHTLVGGGDLGEVKEKLDKILDADRFDP